MPFVRFPVACRLLTFCLLLPLATGCEEDPAPTGWEDIPTPDFSGPQPGLEEPGARPWQHAGSFYPEDPADLYRNVVGLMRDTGVGQRGAAAAVITPPTRACGTRGRCRPRCSRASRCPRWWWCSPRTTSSKGSRSPCGGWGRG